MHSTWQRKSPHRAIRPRDARGDRWSRLLDGPYRWGSFDVVLRRHGVRHYRLIVYPPGINTADRRLARLWRGWPLSGTTLIVLAVMLLGDVVNAAGLVLARAVAAYVGLGVLLFLRGGPVRVPVRSLSSFLTPATTDDRERRNYGEWRTLVDTLTCADSMLAARTISVIEHEAIWWDAYDRIGAIEPLDSG